MSETIYLNLNAREKYDILKECLKDSDFLALAENYYKQKVSEIKKTKTLRIEAKTKRQIETSIIKETEYAIFTENSIFVKYNIPTLQLNEIVNYDSMNDKEKEDSNIL